jgi:hypothetical protein
VEPIPGFKVTKKLFSSSLLLKQNKLVCLSLACYFPEKHVRVKRSSLFGLFISNKEKKFYKIDTRKASNSPDAKVSCAQSYKTFGGVIFTLIRKNNKILA